MARLDPPLADVRVKIAVFDVDDPFDQIHGPLGLNDVANVGLIDNDTDGDDNRGGSDPAASYYIRETDENGEVRVTLTMSMQPGNNYRAATSVIQDTMSQQRITQEMADALSVRTDGGGSLVANGDFEGYQVPVVWSKMLTVWRKLHVETDTMVRPTFVENTFTMNWDEPRQGPAQTQVVFDVDDPPPDGSDTDDQQFTYGYIALADSVGTLLVPFLVRSFNIC